MKRREFLKSSLAATSVAGLTSVLGATAAEKSAAAPRQFYELRLYHLRRGPKQKVFDDFYREAAIPAMNPSYVRVESSLLVAFEGMPKLELPAAVAGNKPRLFELRTYESHSKKSNQKKIEMFNNGEIAIFRRTGLQPIFFGETLIGTKLPNLAYMLVFENMTAREQNWATFLSDPEWKKLSAMPGYADAELVTNISNIFLRPTAYSQI